MILPLVTASLPLGLIVDHSAAAGPPSAADLAAALERKAGTDALLTEVGSHLRRQPACLVEHLRAYERQRRCAAAIHETLTFSTAGAITTRHR